jgi:hypothetical protein
MLLKDCSEILLCREVGFFVILILVPLVLMIQDLVSIKESV